VFYDAFPEESMMLTLYHHPTAVCAAKVRVVLAEKQLPWDGRIVDMSKGEHHRPEYLALNPNGVIPTLVHDGNVVIESTVISEYLDEAFTANPLRPADAFRRARLHLWTKREDSIHDAINTLTSVMVFCPLQQTRSAKEQAEWTARIPDIAKRQKWIELMRDGANANAVHLALVRLRDLIRDMEGALANGPWLAGDSFTLADSGLISFFARLDALSLDFLLSDSPRVADWSMRCVSRPSFDAAIGQFRSDPMQMTIAAFGKQSQSSIRAAWMAASGDQAISVNTPIPKAPNG
jgi:glutathione S-transferase